jgi:sugar phosphate isomerase/epimerase
VVSAISINTLSLAPAAFSAQVDCVARLGVSGLSPDLEQIIPVGVSAAANLIADAGLKVATLTHRAFGFATPPETRSAQERLNKTVAVAAQLGANTIIMTTGGRGALTWDEATEAFAEAVAPCAALAKEAGIRLGIEPTSHLYADVSIAHRLSDTITLAQRAGIDVMIDLFACWTDADIDQATVTAAPASPLVQVSDYVYGDRGLPCRAVPGDGALPLQRLTSTLIKAGFAGWFDLEIIGPRLQSECQEAGLRRAVSFMEQMIREASL